MNFQKMMQQAQQVQFKLAEMQEKLKDIDVDGISGGGLVRVTMNCVGDVRNIVIDPSVIVADERETLEDLILAALSHASQAKDERVKQETQGMMKQLGLPEGTQLPV